MGGEWSAGSVLVSETWPAEHRGKAIGIMQSGWAVGYILAALVSAVVLPRFGWRALFLIGILPAFLVAWIRRHVPEPEIWVKNKGARRDEARSSIGVIFRPPLLKKTLTASLLTTSVLFAYWGLFTWMPTFLSRPVADGGAGLGIVKSSAWIVPMQIGAFFGYLLFGFLADRFGRRPVFIAFLVAAALLVPLYGQLARQELWLFILGPFIGFFGHGYFSVFGAMLAELFPTHVRATAQGLTYNVGRAFSALAPFLIGALSDVYGIGSALGLTAFFFLLGAVVMFLMPETKGRELE
jgi:MFS family permease